MKKFAVVLLVLTLSACDHTGPIETLRDKPSPAVAGTETAETAGETRMTNPEN